MQIGYQGPNDPNSVNARWVRFIVNPRNIQATRDAMRNVKAAGKQVLLTVGDGPGGKYAKTIGPKQAKRIISQLPRADKYTWTNEPDAAGKNPANYARGWMELRKSLGNSLLWGDFSPNNPVGFTLAARKAVNNLPTNLQFAVHPYQFHSKPWQGSMSNLANMQKSLDRRGIRTQLWLDEFGYHPHDQAYWQGAISRAKKLKAKMLLAYDVQGPTWNTALTDQSRAYLRNA